MPRSGSTLIEQMLASHPRVVGGGERGDFTAALRAAARREGSLDDSDAFVAALTPEMLRRIGASYVERLESAAAMVCRSLAELWNELRKYPTDDAFVIGGEAVYAQLLPFCNHLFVTEIAKKYTADKFFVNINEEKGWYLTAQSDYKTHNDIPYRFLEYVKHG
jgi:hypothetical protein